MVRDVGRFNPEWRSSIDVNPHKKAFTGTACYHGKNETGQTKGVAEIAFDTTG